MLKGADPTYSAARKYKECGGQTQDLNFARAKRR